MPKKATNSEAPWKAPQSLLERAKRITRPRDFYSGFTRIAAHAPDNIILFNRVSSRAMEDSLKSPHFNQRHALVIPLLGAGTLILDDRRHPLSPGECGLMLPYQFHSYAFGYVDVIEWLFITFDLPSSSFTLDPGQQSFRPPGRFWDRLDEFIEEYQTSAPDADRLSCLLFLMLGDMIREPIKQIVPTTGDMDLLARVRALAMQDLRRPLSISTVAKTLGVSNSHLRERFRKDAGRSLGTFLRAVRLQHAAHMLSIGKGNVSETAVACGWNDPYSFSRAFHAYWGQTPKRFSLLKRQKTAGE